MKHFTISQSSPQFCKFAFLLLMSALYSSSHAQNDYSPCYKENMAAGDTAFNQRNFKAAKSYYVKAKHCKGGNTKEAKEKIERVKVNREAWRFIQRLQKLNKRDFERAAKRRHNKKSGRPYWC